MDKEKIELKLAELEKELIDTFPNAELLISPDIGKWGASTVVYTCSEKDFEPLRALCRKLSDRTRNGDYHFSFRAQLLPDPALSPYTADYYIKRGQDFLKRMNEDKARAKAAATHSSSVGCP